MAELEKDREEKHKAISERERSEKDLKESTNKMKEIEVVLKDVVHNIVLSTHGHQDGVHLNCDGSDLLRDNLLNVLNS